jgi:hypothetical protein
VHRAALFEIDSIVFLEYWTYMVPEAKFKDLDLHVEYMDLNDTRS